jgi:hypothetical protein
VSSSIAAGSSQNIILCGLSLQASGYFNNGTVAATSGVNNGMSRTVKSYNPGSITLVAPFPNVFTTGDTFNITPGCTKNFSGAIQSFNGSATDGSTPLIILSGNGAPGGMYNGMTLLFTSGANNAQGQIIESWTAGRAVMRAPFLNAPTLGDAFNIINPSGTIVSIANIVTSVRTQSTIPSNLTNADGFFNGGTLQFTSGTNVGQTQTVSAWTNGIATTSGTFSNVPAVGDEFSISSISTNTQGTCTGFWGADAPLHFGGERFIPVPETSL